MGMATNSEGGNRGFSLPFFFLSLTSMGEIAEMMEDRNKRGLPPGFRFHPTDEELVAFYLVSKVLDVGSFPGMEMAEIDLHKCEPWQLPEEAKFGEIEWYFYSLRDRKYPTGLRANRSTMSGYWKATGKDREIFSSSESRLVGFKKTLVFYLGRAPRGEKTRWILHEYRLDGDFSLHNLSDEWVICRVFHKGGSKRKIQLSAASAPTGTLPPRHGYSPPSAATNPSLMTQESQRPVLQMGLDYPDLLPAIIGWESWNC